MHSLMLAILCFVLILEAFMLATSIMKFHVPESQWLDPLATKTIPFAQLLTCGGIAVAIWLSHDGNNSGKSAVPLLLYSILSLVATEVSVSLLRPLN
jgi:hypothetical protein